MVRSSKETINVLMNIETYFGEHQGRLGPFIKTLLIGLAPTFVGLVLPSKYYGIGLVLEVLWFIRVALYILGNEPAKLRQYLYSEDDEYAAADDLVRVSDIHDDGLVEYVNGEIVYILSGYFMTYQNDDALSIDVQNFLELFKGFVYDVYCHNVVDEFKLQNRLESMKVYSDTELMQERVRFYMLQDARCSAKSKLYRINIVVRAYRYNWKKLKVAVDNALASDYASVFKTISCLTDTAEVNDVLSRDLGTNINMEKMLISKYKNQNYYGSKVLFYGDEVPEKYLPKEEYTGIENQRVVDEM